MTGDFEGSLPPQFQGASIDNAVAAALTVVETLGVPIFFVPGNHDSPTIRHTGNVDRSMQKLGEVRIVGIGGAGPHRFGFPYEWSEAEIRRLTLPSWDILISHAPPAGTQLDRLARSGEHVGSYAIKKLARKQSGLLVCGHIHEAVGYQRVGKCIFYNVGSLGDPYGKTQFGIVDFDPKSRATQISHVDLEV